MKAAPHRPGRIRSLFSVFACVLGVLSIGMSATRSAETFRGLEPSEDYGPLLVAYARVDRPDGTYRRMLTQPETLTAMAEDGDLPDGTRLLMETYYTPGSVGTVFHAMKVDGRWQYGSFPASRPDLSVRPQASCLSCHAGAAETDFVFTLPSLAAAARGGGASRFACDRGGRQPCAKHVYRTGAGH